MLVFLHTNDHHEHLFNLQPVDFDGPRGFVSDKLTSVTHNAVPEIYMTHMYISHDVHCYAYVKVKLYFLLQLIT